MFHAVLEFKTTTQEELQDLSASITAGELGLFESEAKFSSKMTDLKKTKNLKIDSFQQGGTDQKVKIDIDGIIERAVNFPAQVKVAAEPYFAVLMDYTAIDMPAPLNEVKIENAKMVIQRYYKLRSQIMQMLIDIGRRRRSADDELNTEIRRRRMVSLPGRCDGHPAGTVGAGQSGRLRLQWRPERPTPSWGGRCSNPGENSGPGGDITWCPRRACAAARK